jgi:heat shock protein HslJ
MSSDKAIEDATWILVSATDKAGNDVQIPAEAGATLSISDGRMAIQTGCNSGGGAVEVSPSALEVGPIMTTKMACPEPRMTLEQTVLGVLGTRSSYQIDGELLTINNSAGTLVYRLLPISSEASEGSATGTGSSAGPATPGPATRFTPAPSSIQPLPLPSHTKLLPSIPEDPRGSTN